MRKLRIGLVEYIVPKPGTGFPSVIPFLFDLDESAVVGGRKGVAKILSRYTIDQPALNVGTPTQFASTTGATAAAVANVIDIVASADDNVFAMVKGMRQCNFLENFDLFRHPPTNDVTIRTLRCTSACACNVRLIGDGIRAPSVAEKRVDGSTGSFAHSVQLYRSIVLVHYGLVIKFDGGHGRKEAVVDRMRSIGRIIRKLWLAGPEAFVVCHPVAPRNDPRPRCCPLEKPYSLFSSFGIELGVGAVKGEILGR